MTLGELSGRKPEPVPRRLDWQVHSGPGLSPSEYVSVLAMKTAPVLAQVYQQEDTDENTRQEINRILSGAKGSIEVSVGIVKALHDAGLASDSVLSTTQIDDAGFRDIRYQQDALGEVDLLRVAGYALHVPTGEGVEEKRRSFLNIRAARGNNGYDFNHWTLSRSAEVNL